MFCTRTKVVRTVHFSKIHCLPKNFCKVTTIFGNTQTKQEKFFNFSTRQADLLTLHYFREDRLHLGIKNKLAFILFSSRFALSLPPLINKV